MAENTKVAEPKVETFDDIKSKTSFEDSDLDIIAAEARKERDAEKAAKETPIEEEPKKEEKPAPKEEETGKEEISAEDKAKKEAEEKTKEEARIIEAKDEDLKPEEKTRKTELLKAREEEEVKAIAKEYSISEDEARQSLEHVQKVRDKYKDSPKELAKANYFQQKYLSKLTEEHQKLKAEPIQKPVELSIDGVIKLLDDGKMKLPDGKVITRDKVIEAYRKEYADITETVDDDTVVKMAAKEMIKSHESKQREMVIERTAKAKDKRAELLKSVTEADKVYLPDIEPIINNLSDDGILDERFSLADTLNWAKGKHYDQSVKDAEERGYKRGKEEAKILGEKKPPTGGTGATKGKTRSLTEAEKRRALDMFDGQSIPDEEKFKMFIEINTPPKKKE